MVRRCRQGRASAWEVAVVAAATTMKRPGPPARRRHDPMGPRFECRQGSRSIWGHPPTTGGTTRGCSRPPIGGRSRGPGVADHHRDGHDDRRRRSAGRPRRDSGVVLGGQPAGRGSTTFYPSQGGGVGRRASPAGIDHQPADVGNRQGGHDCQHYHHQGQRGGLAPIVPALWLSSSWPHQASRPSEPDGRPTFGRRSVAASWVGGSGTHEVSPFGRSEQDTTEVPRWSLAVGRRAARAVSRRRRRCRGWRRPTPPRAPRRHS